MFFFLMNLTKIYLLCCNFIEIQGHVVLRSDVSLRSSGLRIKEHVRIYSCELNSTIITFRKFLYEEISFPLLLGGI